MLESKLGKSLELISAKSRAISCIVEGFPFSLSKTYFYVLISASDNFSEPVKGLISTFISHLIFKGGNLS